MLTTPEPSWAGCDEPITDGQIMPGGADASERLTQETQSPHLIGAPELGSQPTDIYPWNPSSAAHRASDQNTSCPPAAERAARARAAPGHQLQSTHTHNTARRGSGQAAWALPTLVPGAFPTCEGIYWETTNQV